MPGRERLVLRGARANNLHGLDVEIPLGMLVAITGVSGSGKSTLVHQVLYRAVARALGQSDGADPSGVFTSLTGVERLNDVVLVDQTPIGRTPRSNPITYIKGFDLVRELFAAQPEAKRLSLTPGHFSFNVPGGRCNTCEGDGTVTVEMQFLADVELPCEDCNGTRYQAKVLQVEYKGKNIHDVLQMTVKEALRFFAGQTRLLEKLAVLDEIGLGYLRLGQSATTLSGGEAQRVKLAAHLAQVRAANANAKPSQASRVLYILDEPTTGLHFDDVSKLLTAFRKLIDGGGSLIVIEHNLDVIKSRRLGDRSGAGGRRGRRPDRGRRHAGGDRGQSAFAYRQVARAGTVKQHSRLLFPFLLRNPEGAGDFSPRKGRGISWAFRPGPFSEHAVSLCSVTIGCRAGGLYATPPIPCRFTCHLSHGPRTRRRGRGASRQPPRVLPDSPLPDALWAPDRTD